MVESAHWTLDDISWDRFDPARVDPDLLQLVKTAAVVEENSKDYAAYLKNVFPDDQDFHGEIDRWAHEEEQHGQALSKWAMLADPSFVYEKAFQTFREGYKIPIESTTSVRGSRTGELLARCVVEAGTSSYYTALKDATTEPVLAEICRHIAADEFRHYKLFYQVSKRYQAKEHLSLFERLKVVYGRVAEVDDDELSYAYYATNAVHEAYRPTHFQRLYFYKAYKMYQKFHLERAAGMILKAVGLAPQGWVHKIGFAVFWRLLSNRLKASKRYLNL